MCWIFVHEYICREGYKDLLAYGNFAIHAFSKQLLIDKYEHRPDRPVPLHTTPHRNNGK